MQPENQNASYLGSPPGFESSRRNPHLGFNFRPSDINYQDVMKRLVSRYIHQTKKQLRQDGVNEDDLLEIKQDISSLRYELREDRKRETARNTGQIDSIKRDIIRSLRGNQAWLPSQDVSSPAGLFTPMELESLKQELVFCLREEMRSLLAKEPPVGNTDLYQTHLYTQL
ncbi:transient-receptor-potential-like protein [Trichonephila clavata]|uniref:Transient-receptor-potential-like protein n=1 Tax=Trichonephila clavata TaxID=2740835 RepID=A0A8X6JHT9_TRICU|nr:transient-receptor-potential-like protein [Trichonephila clavata]